MPQRGSRARAACNRGLGLRARALPASCPRHRVKRPVLGPEPLGCGEGYRMCFSGDFEDQASGRVQPWNEKRGHPCPMQSQRRDRTKWNGEKSSFLGVSHITKGAPPGMAARDSWEECKDKEAGRRNACWVLSPKLFSVLKQSSTWLQIHQECMKWRF